MALLPLYALRILDLDATLCSLKMYHVVNFVDFLFYLLMRRDIKDFFVDHVQDQETANLGI